MVFFDRFELQDDPVLHQDVRYVLPNILAFIRNPDQKSKGRFLKRKRLSWHGSGGAGHADGHGYCLSILKKSGTRFLETGCPPRPGGGFWLRGGSWPFVPPGADFLQKSAFRFLKVKGRKAGPPFARPGLPARAGRPGRSGTCPRLWPASDSPVSFAGDNVSWG